METVPTNGKFQAAILSSGKYRESLKPVSIMKSCPSSNSDTSTSMCAHDQRSACLSLSHSCDPRRVGLNHCPSPNSANVDFTWTCFRILFTQAIRRLNERFAYEVFVCGKVYGN